MKVITRALNERGLARFQGWLETGAAGDAPFELLTDPDTSDSVPGAGEVDQRDFPSRYELALHILDALEGCDFGRISFHKGLWSWLSLFYLDLIAPENSEGKRSRPPTYALILTPFYREYYRHIVRESVILAREHGEFSQVLLVSPTGGIKVTASLVEIASRQELCSYPSVVELAFRLYFDARRRAVRRGIAANERPGSVRRLAVVLQQLSLNFDLQAMSARQVFDLLPGEFERWKGRVNFNENSETTALRDAVRAHSNRSAGDGRARPTVSFEGIAIGSIWEREQLATRWGYRTFHALARGVFTPAGDNKIILFVTALQQEGLTHYANQLQNRTLCWEGERNHANDTRIAQSPDKGDTIHVFYREQHHAPFTYHGKALVKSFELFTEKPSKFEFELEALNPEISGGGGGGGNPV
jgi:hypothetical protein